MPKKLSPDVTDRILAEVARHPDGISVDALAEALAGLISRRSLQRRLVELVTQKRLVAAGATQARIYKLPALHAKPDAREQTPEVEAQIPLSKEGDEIATLVRRPLQARKPVGYNRAFLESYQPNKTYYLSDADREHLHQIGRSPAEERPAGTYARDILDRLLVDLSWASSRLEGNTYTRLDTVRLIEHGIAAPGKDAAETQMILNHKRAIEMLVDEADQVGMNWFTFMNLHAILSDNLMADQSASGRLRQRDVGIGGTVFIPLATPQLIEECFRLLLQKADAIADPFEQALFVLVHIPYLQPFEDVNKRVSRVGANISLIKHNLCPLSFIGVNERDYVAGILGVYELNRTELLRDVFVWSYERSRQQYLAVKQSLAEPDPFRLEHRAQLSEVVGMVVRGRQPLAEEPVRQAAKSIVRAEDLDRFVAMALSDLQHLHEGNIARYQLRLFEYRAWKQSLGEQTR